nr:uncharacterized protein LOC128680768 [Plodia interpunctella]
MIKKSFLLCILVYALFRVIEGNFWPPYYHDLVRDFMVPPVYNLEVSNAVPDLTKIKNCSMCPRVYWPVCAKDNISYFNHCVLKCLNKSSLYRRDGVCINYRRNLNMNTSIINLILPKDVAKNESQHKYEHTAFTKDITFYSATFLNQ